MPDVYNASHLPIHCDSRFVRFNCLSFPYQGTNLAFSYKEDASPTLLSRLLNEQSIV